MGDRTSYPNGTFNWIELLTPDEADAKRFYGGLFGWDYDEQPIDGGGTYTMVRAGGKEAAGMHQPGTEQQGVPPNWLSYAAVDDVDATASRAAELGGTVMAGPFDVMESGRMAVIQDPTGAVLGLWQANKNIGATVVNVHGALTMNQLNTSDPEAASSFYSELLGWQVAALDTGDGPPYWSIENSEGRLNGGMMDLPADAQAPSHWLAYFAVEDLDAATGRIGELGGQVLVPPTPIPSGRFAVARDPQGAYFALFEGELDP